MKYLILHIRSFPFSFIRSLGYSVNRKLCSVGVNHNCAATLSLKLQFMKRLSALCNDKQLSRKSNEWQILGDDAKCCLQNFSLSDVAKVLEFLTVTFCESKIVVDLFVNHASIKLIENFPLVNFNSSGFHNPIEHQKFSVLALHHVNQTDSLDDQSNLKLLDAISIFVSLSRIKYKRNKDIFRILCRILHEYIHFLAPSDVYKIIFGIARVKYIQDKEFLIVAKEIIYKYSGIRNSLTVTDRNLGIDKYQVYDSKLESYDDSYQSNIDSCKILTSLSIESNESTLSLNALIQTLDGFTRLGITTWKLLDHTASCVILKIKNDLSSSYNESSVDENYKNGDDSEFWRNRRYSSVENTVNCVTNKNIVCKASILTTYEIFRLLHVCIFHKYRNETFYFFLSSWAEKNSIHTADPQILCRIFFSFCYLRILFNQNYVNFLINQIFSMKTLYKLRPEGLVYATRSLSLLQLFSENNVGLSSINLSVRDVKSRFCRAICKIVRKSSDKFQAKHIFHILQSLFLLQFEDSEKILGRDFVYEELLKRSRYFKATDIPEIEMFAGFYLNEAQKKELISRMEFDLNKWGTMENNSRDE